MQKVAAYLLERRDGMASEQARADEVGAIKSSVDAWLRSKGAAGIAQSGTYDAEDGSHATFDVEEAADGARSWWLVRLAEVTPDGRRFLAALSVTSTADTVAVYGTMEVGSNATLISPVEVDPKTPKVIRSLLDLPGRWFHGGSELRPIQSVSGFEEGEGLAEEIASPQRTVPIIVVTRAPEGEVLPRLAEKLAFDLAGLANVVEVDADATWALTDQLGRPLSCFWGAVRLYWPRLNLREDPYRHPLWTAEKLQSTSGDPRVTRERFRKQLRGLVMRASALSVVRPREIDDIRGTASRRAFAEMKERATSLTDFADLAESYARENDELRRKLREGQETIEELQGRIVELEGERAALLVRVESAEVQLRYREAVAEEIAPDQAQGDDEVGEPTRGEVRFYKKRYDTPSHDVMVRTQDCGCNRWENSHSADKARKGIAKLENGRNDWRQMQHCASCTGGGMWRVRW